MGWLRKLSKNLQKITDSAAVNVVKEIPGIGDTVKVVDTFVDIGAGTREPVEGIQFVAPKTYKRLVKAKEDGVIDATECTEIVGVFLKETGLGNQVLIK